MKFLMFTLACLAPSLAMGQTYSYDDNIAELEAIIDMQDAYMDDLGVKAQEKLAQAATVLSFQTTYNGFVAQNNSLKDAIRDAQTATLLDADLQAAYKQEIDNAVDQVNAAHDHLLQAEWHLKISLYEYQKAKEYYADGFTDLTSVIAHADAAISGFSYLNYYLGAAMSAMEAAGKSLSNGLTLRDVDLLLAM